MIRYTEDPLLSAKYFINGKPNLYWAYIWPEDFKNIEFRRRIPWAKGEDLKQEIIQHLDGLDYIKLKELAKAIQEYTELRYKIQKDFIITLRKDIQRGRIDFVLLRVLSRLISEEREFKIFHYFISKADYITDYTNLGKFTPPLTRKELLSDANIYIAGCQAGDGHLSTKNATICDGTKNSKDLDSTTQHLSNIKNKISRSYRMYSYIKKANKYCTLIIANKWYVRHYHKFFDLPIGKKTKLREPEILDSLAKRCVFWRGVLDSDGSFNGFTVRLSMNMPSFIQQYAKLLNELNILYSYDIRNNSEGVSIFVKSLKNFIEFIGFSHPRKKAHLLRKLERGLKFRQFYGVNSESIDTDGFYDLTKIKGLRLIGAENIFNELVKKLDYKITRLAKRFNYSHSTLIDWRKGNVSIPFNLLLELWIEAGYTKKDMYRRIQKTYNILFCGRTGCGSVRFPLQPQRYALDIIKNMRPMHQSQTVYITSKSGIIESLFEDIRRIFKVEVSNDSEKLVIFSRILYEFLTRFHIYDVPWKVDKGEIVKFKNAIL